MTLTKDLVDAALDYAVAISIKLSAKLVQTELGLVCMATNPAGITFAFCPSKNLAVGMPLIWKFNIAIFKASDGWAAAVPDDEGYYRPEGDYIDVNGSNACVMCGPEPLIAGCRALVMATQGLEVEIPPVSTSL